MGTVLSLQPWRCTVIQCEMFVVRSDLRQGMDEINAALERLDREGKKLLFASQSSAPNQAHGTVTYVTVFYR